MNVRTCCFCDHSIPDKEKAVRLPTQAWAHFRCWCEKGSR